MMLIPKWLRRFAQRKPAPRRYRPRMEELEDRCLLAAPVLDPISNVTLPAGKSLIVPLTATDTDGNPLTYTFSSSNGTITTHLHTGN